MTKPTLNEVLAELKEHAEKEIGDDNGAEEV